MMKAIQLALGAILLCNSVDDGLGHDKITPLERFQVFKLFKLCFRH